MKLQIKKTSTFKDAVAVAREWYGRHGIGYGIEIDYQVPEIGELIRVRDFYLINSVEEICEVTTTHEIILVGRSGIIA